MSRLGFARLLTALPPRVRPLRWPRSRAASSVPALADVELVVEPDEMLLHRRLGYEQRAVLRMDAGWVNTEPEKSFPHSRTRTSLSLGICRGGFPARMVDLSPGPVSVDCRTGPSRRHESRLPSGPLRRCSQRRLPNGRK
jgi:hypothetical protein